MKRTLLAMALLLTSVFGVTGCGSDDDVAVESRVKNAAPGVSGASDAPSQADCDLRDLLDVLDLSDRLDRLDRLVLSDLSDRLDRLDRLVLSDLSDRLVRLDLDRLVRRDLRDLRDLRDDLDDLRDRLDQCAAASKSDGVDGG